MSGIFTEGCERIEAALKRNENWKDELIEELVTALDKAYSDAIWVLNYGDFKQKIEWDAGYIVDVLAKAKREGYGEKLSAGDEKNPKTNEETNDCG